LANTRGHTVGGSEGFGFPISSNNIAGDTNKGTTTSTSSHSHDNLYNGTVTPPLSPSSSKRPSNRSAENIQQSPRDLYVITEGLPSLRSPPQSPPNPTSTSPINISDKFRRLKLATENTTPAASLPATSPIIGSNPKRSWFSNFFTGSPQSSPRDVMFSIPTELDGDELMDELNRTLSALGSQWQLYGEHLLSASYKSLDGTEVEFSVEVMDGKSKLNTDIRVVALTLQKGPPHYFNFLCAQFRNEANLE